MPNADNFLPGSQSSRHQEASLPWSELAGNQFATKKKGNRKLRKLKGNFFFCDKDWFNNARILEFPEDKNTRKIVARTVQSSENITEENYLKLCY